eukprot:GSChrysophyteH1.ASY1.ANO1.1836.1 assembled CDS
MHLQHYDIIKQFFSGGAIYGDASDKIPFPNPNLTNVTTLYSTLNAFAALKSDHTVVTWGHKDYGGNSTIVSSSLTQVKEVYSCLSTFVALKTDGTVVVWGGDEGLIDTSKIPSNEKVVSITANLGAFAALTNQSHVYFFGQETYGGKSEPIKTPVRAIYANEFALVVAFKDKEVVPTIRAVGGGYQRLNGGDASPCEDMINIENIYSTDPAFTDQNSTHVCAFGAYYPPYQNNSNNPTTVTIPSDINRVEIASIFATTQTFAGLTTEGELYVWGYLNTYETTSTHGKINIDSAFGGIRNIITSVDTILILYNSGQIQIIGQRKLQPYSGPSFTVTNIYANKVGFVVLGVNGIQSYCLLMTVVFATVTT